MANPVGGMTSGLMNQLKSSDAGRAQLAGALHKGGAISAALMGDLTSSSVSMQDLSAAKGLAESLKGKPMGEVASALADGLQLKYDSQSMLKTAGATALDLGGASSHEVAKQGIRNIR